MEDALRNLLNQYDDIVEDMVAGPVGQADDLNHFTLWGPRLANLYSTVLPWKEPLLSEAALQLLQVTQQHDQPHRRPQRLDVRHPTLPDLVPLTPLA